MKRRVERFGALLLSAALLMTTAAFALPETPEYSVSASENVRRQELVYFTADDTWLREWDAEPMGRQLPALPEAGTYREGELLVKVSPAIAATSSGDHLFETAADKYVEDLEYLFSTGNDEVGMFSDEAEDDNGQEQIWLRLTLHEDADMLTAWREIAECDSVIAVEPNYTRTALGAESSVAEINDSDPYIHAQAWLESMNAVSAWAELKSAPGVAAEGNPIIVAVVDSGVDVDHPDLEENLLPGYDFVDKDNSPNDENGHGTHVAGIIAAVNNAVGVRGVAYGAKILPVRVLDQNGSGSGADIGAGIEYAVKHGANIINLSLGGYGGSLAEQDAIQYARKAGCLVVAAAGNESAPTAAAGTYGGAVCTPANYPGVLTVMAANNSWELASFSNYDNDPGEGVEYELMAPGVDILSTTCDGGYGRMSGTSMACPAAAGAAAVLMGMGCTAEQAFALLATCEKKTVTVNGVSFSYPALDLDVCVRRAQTCLVDSSQPNYPVNATNGVVFASLEPQNFGHGAVDFSGMNTTSRVYFRKDSLVSTLSVEVENIGGAGSVQLTGSVGGCVVNQTLTLEQGGTAAAKLSFTGTPKVDEDGDVLVELYADGAQLYRNWFAAYELKTPEDSEAIRTETATSADGDTYSYYTPRTSGLSELNGESAMGVVWVIDKDLVVLPTQELEIVRREGEKRLIVYQTSVNYIEVPQVKYGNDYSYGSLFVGGADLLSESTFKIFGYGDVALGYSAVYDPYIEWTDYMWNCETWENGCTKLKLNAFSIYESGFYDLRGLSIQSTYFLRNMVNNCVNTELTVRNLAQANTFVENFGSTSDSVMTVYAPNYSGSSQATYVSDDSEAAFPYSGGFCFNSVIGPMSVYRYGTSTDLAKVYKVYYQPVNSDSITITPEGSADQLICDSNSTVSSRIDDLNAWGFAADSPAFILGTECTEYEINPNGWIDYEVNVYFSTPVNKTNRFYPDSATDDMIGSAGISFLADDGSYCTITGSSINNGYNTVNYYSAYGFFTQKNVISEKVSHYFGWAGLESQTTFRYPVAFGDWYYRNRLEHMAVTMSSDGSRTVTWSDERLTDAHTATIERSTDGGVTYTALVSGVVGGSYLDREAMPADTLLTYRVTLGGTGVRRYTGTAQLLLALNDQEMGLDLAAERFTDDGRGVFSASLNGKWLIRDHLTLTLPGVDYCSIEFGDAVKDAGILYGAITEKDEAGVPSTTVYIGSGDYEFLPAGEPLFTVTIPLNENGTRTVTAAGEGSGADQWGKNGQCQYVTAPSGKAGWGSHGGQMALYRGSGHVVAAYYLANGRMTKVFDVTNDLYPMEEGSILKAFFLTDDLIPTGEPVAAGEQTMP